MGSWEYTLVRVAAWSVTIAVAAGCGGTGGLAARSKPSMRLGGAVTERGGAPIGGAVVTLCELEPETGISFNLEWPGCAREFGVGSTGEDGRFELAWNGAPADLEHAKLIFRQPGFGLRVVSATAFAKDRSVTLEKTAVIHAIVVAAETHAPIANAEYGWFTQDGPVLRVRYFDCCSGDNGRVDLTFEHSPESEITVFAIAPASAKYALAGVALAPEQNLQVSLEVTKSLYEVRGRVVASDALPVAGAISIKAAAESGDVLFERVLALIQGGVTETDGRFQFRVGASGEYDISFAEWTAGNGSRPGHFGERVLATERVTVGAEAREVVLHANPERIVSCSLQDDRGAALNIQQLGLSFGPHLGWAHSDSCVQLPRAPASVGSNTVRFAWPEGAESLAVEARSVTRALPDQPSLTIVGTHELNVADSDCRIRAHAE